MSTISSNALRAAIYARDVKSTAFERLAGVDGQHAGRLAVPLSCLSPDSHSPDPQLTESDRGYIDNLALSSSSVPPASYTRLRLTFP